MAVRVPANTHGLSKNHLFGMALIAAAIVLGSLLIARGVAPVKVKTEREPIVVGEFDTVRVPVPTTLVPAGTRMRDIPIKFVSIPKNQLPENALTSVEPLMEAMTVAPLPANIPFFAENFSTLRAGNPVIERIPAGMRAMTILVDATSGIEGWASAGTVVDVILIEKDKTIVIAEKVKILSAERSIQPMDSANRVATPPKTITILVSQEQCLAINTAIPRGKITLALRSLSDEENWKDTNFAAERLHGGVVKQATDSQVTGFVKIEGQSPQAFALSGGKWTKSDVIPEGFFAANGERVVKREGE